MDDGRWRHGDDLEERVRHLEEEAAVTRWRIRLLEVVVGAFCASVLLTFLGMLVSGVFGDRPPRLAPPSYRQGVMP